MTKGETKENLVHWYKTFDEAAKTKSADTGLTKEIISYYILHSSYIYTPIYLFYIGVV